MTTNANFACGIDAAILWPNNKVYFFKGSQYLRFDAAENRVDQAPNGIAAGWGNWPASWADGIDGAHMMPNYRYAYFFKGSQYLRFDLQTNRVSDGYPTELPGNWNGWPADWTTGIDGCIYWPINQKVYFFKGSNFFGYDLVADRAEAVLPIAGNWGNWPADWTGGINGGIVWPDGVKAYLFRGTSYIRYDVNANITDAGYPAAILDHWPGWPTPAPQVRNLSAATDWGNGKAYFFCGSQFVRYDFNNGSVDPGYPQPITSAWPGVWASGIDAVIKWSDSVAYFFKGDQYIRYEIATNQIALGYPKPIAGNWPGLWPDGIDSAIMWLRHREPSKVFFFKGDQYMSYDIASNRVDPGYPVSLANWPGLFSDGIDAALSGRFPKVYFFRGSHYVSFDIIANRVDPGDPAAISAGMWATLEPGFLDLPNQVDPNDHTNWMSSIPGIATKTLRNLCLPASHDSGATALTDTLAPTSVLYDFDFLPNLYPTLNVDYLLNAVDSNIPSYVHEILRVAAGPLQSLVSAAVRNNVQGWAVATGLSVREQLTAGVRWFDLRVCSLGGELRSFHGFTGPLYLDILSEVADFLAVARSEVVVLKASHMGSLTLNDHQTFTQMIETILAPHLLPYDATAGGFTERPLGDLTRNADGQPISRVVFLYSTADDGSSAGYDDYKARKNNVNLLIWPDTSVETVTADNAGIPSMDQIGTCQSSELAGYTSDENKLFRLDFAYTPRTADILPSVLMSILDVLHMQGVTTHSQTLRSAAIAANRQLLPFLQQTSSANRAKINLISLDFVECSYAAYLAIALSTGDSAAIDAPPNYIPLPDSDFAIAMKYNQTINPSQPGIHVDQVIPHIDLPPHVDSYGAHMDLNVFFHIDVAPHIDTRGDNHIDTPEQHLNVTPPAADFHVDAN